MREAARKAAQRPVAVVARLSNVRRWRLRRSARLVKPDMDVVAGHMAPGILIIAMFSVLFTIRSSDSEVARHIRDLALSLFLFCVPLAFAVGIGILEKNWPWRYRKWVCAVNLAPVPIWLVLCVLCSL